MQNTNKVTFAFFGTSRFSVFVLEELKKAGYIPALIITTEDKAKGRKLILTPSEVKKWALAENIPFITPKSLKTPETLDEIKKYSENYDFFIVASYGKIIPQNILDLPKHQTINVHPSLLPRLRGASPIQSAILSENETGVTIMRLDAEMDHGPLLAQEKVSVPEWPPYKKDLEENLAKKGGELLVRIIPDWISGKLAEIPQDHDSATYCKKIEKSDGEINLDGDPELNIRKIRAFHMWPGAYFFIHHKGTQKRVVIKSAHIEDGKLILERVVPEGKNEMFYKDFLNGFKN
ncbi:MAG: methionyl-tRNA formyltransferase [bacterium]